MTLTPKLHQQAFGVVGAGLMGAGIAQVAAQAGHEVLLFDARGGAAAAAKVHIGEALAKLSAKGRLDEATATQALARIHALEALDQMHAAALVVEAIVEDLPAKRSLLAQLEGIVGAHTVLASNTSSISITAIARGLQHPGRCVGMHFFNPVPLMKLVEVVSGLQTQPEVAQAVFDLAQSWGKVAVHAKSTPGFIVNRIARPFYAEALALLQEQATSAEMLDACMRAAGFRMGPCELMDLIGHDTNFAVTQSVFEANFFDRRYGPSGVQREMVAGGLLGRKSGHGFYRYPPGPPALPVPVFDAPATAGRFTLHGQGPLADALQAAAARALAPQGWGPARTAGDDFGQGVGIEVDGAWLLLTDGQCAAEWAQRLGCADVAVFDRPLAALGAAPGGPAAHGALAYALNEGASPAWREQAPRWLHALGFTPLPLADAPGLVVARTIAMLINEAADAVQQGVCSSEAADAAMKLGVNYPQGPFEWLAAWSPKEVVALLKRLDEHYRGERYRVSPWLRQRALQG